MCGVHSDIIDDPAQQYTVADILEMKRTHQETVARERAEHRARRTESSAQTGDSPGGLATTPRLLLIEDVPTWQRKAVRKLAQDEPETWNWICQRVGNPAEPSRVAELVDEWPDRLAEGSPHLLYAVARLAEGSAQWAAASEIWQRLGERYENIKCADHLVRAAIDADVGGDHARRKQLLEKAEKLDPDSTRLRLERLDERALSPAEQLDVLGGLHSDDPALGSLIAVHRALASMLLPDLEEADRHLVRAKELEPDSLQVRSMSINLRVQHARIALRDDRPFSLVEARTTMQEALDLRETMIRMARWEESGRLLMLAADVPALLRDPCGAQRLLEQAHSEELKAPNGAEVLGDAALRAGADELALLLTDEADPTDAVRRIRATARATLPGQRASALSTLRDMALRDGPERDLAAVARLSACLAPTRAPWDDEVATVLASGRHAGIEQRLRIMALATHGRVAAAWALAEQLPDEMWAAELRLRVAGERGNFQLLKETAQHLLAFGPDASGRLLAGLAFAKAGELERAGEVLASVAHDVNAPPIVRTDAFAGDMRTLADRGEWSQATRTWSEWQQFGRRMLDRPDDRISAWQVRIAHHARACA